MAVNFHSDLAIMVDVVTEFAIAGALSEFLNADDLVLLSGTTEGLRTKFMEWKEAFQSKAVVVNLWKTMVMVSGGDMSNSKVDPCVVGSLRVLVFVCTVWLVDPR